MENITHYLLNQLMAWLPKLLGAILIAAFFLVLAKVMRKVIIGGAGRLELDGNLTTLLARIGYMALVIFGLVTALGTLGINVSALVAGLGLTGFALGFALKDTISNLLSGILILLYRPFEIGNRIRLSGYEGIVVSIDLRYTELNSAGQKVLIPNSKLFVDPITVFGPDEDYL